MKTKPAKKPKIDSRLKWNSYFDDNQNEALYADGGINDGEPSDLYYGLVQGVLYNRHVWIEESSKELMIDPESPLSWPKLAVAMRRLQHYHEERIRAKLAEKESAKIE